MLIVLFLVSILAGVLGSILGLGGGIIVVPFMTLVLKLPIEQAIAASLVAIVATSSGAAVAFLKDHLTNLRVAVFLELGTVAGAMSGVLLAQYLSEKLLFIFFGVFLIFSAFQMFQQRKESLAESSHPWAEKLGFSSQYKNAQGAVVAYKVQKVPGALAVMWLAGVLSAVLGIGAGVFKVMAMDRMMKLPIKVSSATSNFMIGVTAAASSGAYLLQGRVVPSLATPVALGVLVGSLIGARLMIKMSAESIRKLFVVVMVLIGVQMVVKGWGL